MGLTLSPSLSLSSSFNFLPPPFFFLPRLILLLPHHHYYRRPPPPFAASADQPPRQSAHVPPRPPLTTIVAHPQSWHPPPGVSHHPSGGAVVARPRHPQPAAIAEPTTAAGHPYKPTGHGNPPNLETQTPNPNPPTSHCRPPLPLEVGGDSPSSVPPFAPWQPNSRLPKLRSSRQLSRACGRWVLCVRSLLNHSGVHALLRFSVRDTWHQNQNIRFLHCLTH